MVKKNPTKSQKFLQISLGIKLFIELGNSSRKMKQYIHKLWLNNITKYTFCQYNWLIIYYMLVKCWPLLFYEKYMKVYSFLKIFLTNNKKFLLLPFYYDNILLDYLKHFN